MVNAPWAEPPLGDLEAAALAQDHVVVGHPHVFKQHFSVAMGSIVVAEYRQRPDNLHPGGIGGHQHHRVLLVARAFGVGQAHEDHHLATRVAGTGSPPLAAVDYPFVTVTDSRGGHVGGVRRGYIRFGHGECRADLAPQQRLEPLALLRLAAIAHQHFHVAGVRCRTVEWLRAQQRTPHDLGQRRVFQVAQAGTVLRLGQEQVPQPFGAGLGLEFLHDCGGLPAVTLRDLALEYRLGGVNMGVHERCNTFTQCLDLGRIGEIHQGYLHGSKYMGRA